MNSAFQLLLSGLEELRPIEYLLYKKALQSKELNSYYDGEHTRFWHPINNNGFKVNLDVQQFKPDELKVKLVDNFVVVEGKHEEQEDRHGWISRQFTRRYKLPGNVVLDSLSSQLSSDGVLTIQAPFKEVVEEEKKDHEVPITQMSSPIIKQADKKQKLDAMDDEN